MNILWLKLGLPHTKPTQIIPPKITRQDPPPFLKGFCISWMFVGQAQTRKRPCWFPCWLARGTTTGVPCWVPCWFSCWVQRELHQALKLEGGWPCWVPCWVPCWLQCFHVVYFNGSFSCILGMNQGSTIGTTRRSISIWQCVKTLYPCSSPQNLAGIYGSSSPQKWY